MAGFKLDLVCLLLGILLVTSAVTAKRGGKHKDRDHHEHKDEWAWGAAAGIAVIIGISIGGAAVFSLLAWLTCGLYTKCRKDRVGDSTLIRIASKGSIPPPWISNLVFKPELAAGFGVVSDGFMRIGAAQLVRSRPGNNKTDGAKWAVGITKGKHVFEITWPWGARGTTATVGLGTEDAPLQSKGSVALVGSNAKSWGLDIVKRRAQHKNRLIVLCPTDGSYVPDKFLMYVDMDEGTIGYGNDVTYWGEVVVGLPTQGEPLFLMVSATKWQSELSVVYRGSASEGDEGKSGMRPPHHLPPLYHVAPHAPSPPPTYREADEKKGGPDSSSTMIHTIIPAIPPQGTEFDPPPPYSRPPTGCSMRE